MNIKEININDLKEYENNPRNNDEAVEPVENSIKEFGFKVPIVVDKNNVIVAGHTRYKAAKKLKLETVPCIVADDLTEEQIKAFRLADNKVSEKAEWDYNALNFELENIINIDMNVFDFDMSGIDDTFGTHFELSDEDKSELEQITFTLYNEQAVAEISKKKLTTLAIDEASKNFLASGLNCIEYKDGRRVNIASYSQMAVRTASLRTHLMGEGDFRASIGRTLVKVTTHGGACPLCTKWQGKVLIDDVYSGGTSTDGNYTLLSDAMKQGFLHPNCRHGITTYYPELDEDDVDIESVNEEQVETQQQLNNANRNIKKYKRLEKGSLDETNISTYRIKRKEWEKNKTKL